MMDANNVDGNEYNDVNDDDEDNADNDSDDKDDDSDDDTRGREAGPGARAEYRQLPARVSSLRSSKVFTVFCISLISISVFLFSLFLYDIKEYQQLPARVSILPSSKVFCNSLPIISLFLCLYSYFFF